MAEKEGVITNMQRRKITLIKTKMDAGMATEKDKKDYEKLRKLYPSMF
tara:strand:- start:198 stop:341 length:144 start_codon:yes stop_codon:yes gene_type:complete